MNFDKFKSDYIWLLIPIGIGTFLAFYNLGYSELQGDEATLIRHTIFFLHGFEVPELFGAIFLYHWGPIRVLTELPFVYFFGLAEFWIRFPHAALCVISMVLIYVIGRYLYSNNIGLISALLFSISGMNPAYRIAVGGSIQIFTNLLTFYFLIKLNEEQNEDKANLYLLLVSVAYALSILTMIEAILFLPGILFILAQKISTGIISKKRIMKAAFVFSVLVLPYYIIWAIIPMFFPSAAGQMHVLNRLTEGFGINLYGAFVFLSCYNSVIYIVLICIGIFASFAGIQNKTKLIYLYVLPYLFFYIILAPKTPGHVMIVLPFLIIPASKGLFNIYDYVAAKKVPIYRYTLVLLFIISLVFSFMHVYTVFIQHDVEPNESPFVVYYEDPGWGSVHREGWKAAGYFVRTHSNYSDKFVSVAYVDSGATTLYLDREYGGEYASNTSDFEYNLASGKEMIDVKYVLLIEQVKNTSVWMYITARYDLSCIVYVDNNPALYIFSRDSVDKVQVQILHDKEYARLFDKEYKNWKNIQREKMKKYISKKYNGFLR